MSFGYSVLILELMSSRSRNNWESMHVMNDGTSLLAREYARGPSKTTLSPAAPEQESEHKHRYLARSVPSKDESDYHTNIIQSHQSRFLAESAEVANNAIVHGIPYRTLPFLVSMGVLSNKTFLINDSPRHRSTARPGIRIS